MARKSHDCVREFQKWNGASADRKVQIILDQAHLFTGPGGTMTLDTITPCGKRLGDCHKADLDAMAKWHRALAAASLAMAKALRRVAMKKKAA